MAKLFVTVVADGNDGDYMERSEEIEPGRLPFLQKIARAIKNFKPGKNRRHNWTRGLDIRPDWPEGTEQTIEKKYEGILTPEEIEEFQDDFEPFNDECEGNHTIKSITVRTITSEEELL